MQDEAKNYAASILRASAASAAPHHTKSIIIVCIPVPLRTMAQTKRTKQTARKTALKWRPRKMLSHMGHGGPLRLRQVAPPQQIAYRSNAGSVEKHAAAAMVARGPGDTGLVENHATAPVVANNPGRDNSKAGRVENNVAGVVVASRGKSGTICDVVQMAMVNQYAGAQRFLGNSILADEEPDLRRKTMTKTAKKI